MCPLGQVSPIPGPQSKLVRSLVANWAAQAAGKLAMLHLRKWCVHTQNHPPAVPAAPEPERLGTVALGREEYV